MNLLLIRHAHAEPLAGEGMTDPERALTQRGRDQCKQLATTLHRLAVPLGTVVTSPLVRARQTVEEILAHWPGAPPPVQTCEDLAPEGKIKKLARFLRMLELQDQVTLVGHMPDLAEFCGWMLGERKAGVHFAKAGAAYIESPVGPGEGHGKLLWLVTPTWYDVV